MSAKDTPVKSTSKLAIVRAIMALFNIGDEGKVESFFGKAQKSLKDDIKAEEQEIKVLEFEFESKSDKLKDELEDAKQAYDESFLTVNLTEIETKSQQSDYVPIYFANIRKKKAYVALVEQKIKDLTESFDATKEASAKKIANFKEELAAISTEAKGATA